jgi:glycine cleavage system regulatory protein
MRSMLVLSVVGADRTGLVQSLAEKISAVGGNWEESRMARLAGQFAGILLVTVDAERSDELVASLRKLEAAGLVITVRPTEAPGAVPASVNIRLQLTANDRPGIIRDVSKILAERGCNVEELETEVASAAMSGDPMFTARARLRAPATTSLADLRARLEALGSELMLDLALE